MATNNIGSNADSWGLFEWFNESQMKLEAMLSHCWELSKRFLNHLDNEILQYSVILENYPNDLMRARWLARWRWNLRIIQLRVRWSWKQCSLIVEKYLMIARGSWRQFFFIVENYPNDLMRARWSWNLRIIQLRARLSWQQCSLIINELSKWFNDCQMKLEAPQRANHPAWNPHFHEFGLPPFLCFANTSPQQTFLCFANTTSLSRKDAKKRHWPEVEKAEGGEGGEEETDEDDWVGSPRYQLAPPEEQTFQAADYKPTCCVHRSHNFCDLRSIKALASSLSSFKQSCSLGHT